MVNHIIVLDISKTFYNVACNSFSQTAVTASLLNYVLDSHMDSQMDIMGMNIFTQLMLTYLRGQFFLAPMVCFLNILLTSKANFQSWNEQQWQDNEYVSIERFWNSVELGCKKPLQFNASKKIAFFELRNNLLLICNLYVLQERSSLEYCSYLHNDALVLGCCSEEGNKTYGWPNSFIQTASLYPSSEQSSSFPSFNNMFISFASKNLLLKFYLLLLPKY